MVVLFNNRAHFLSEMAERPPNVESVVRWVQRNVAHPSGGCQHTLALTYLRYPERATDYDGRHVVRLDEWLGFSDCTLNDPRRREIEKVVAQILADLVFALEPIGLFLARGVYLDGGPGVSG